MNHKPSEDDRVLELVLQVSKMTQGTAMHSPVLSELIEHPRLSAVFASLPYHVRCKLRSAREWWFHKLVIDYTPNYINIAGKAVIVERILEAQAASRLVESVNELGRGLAWRVCEWLTHDQITEGMKLANDYRHLVRDAKRQGVPCHEQALAEYSHRLPDDIRMMRQAYAIETTCEHRGDNAVRNRQGRVVEWREEDERSTRGDDDNERCNEGAEALVMISSR